jgi:hypothetical protein
MLQLAIQIALFLSSLASTDPVASDAGSGSPNAEVREERPPVLQLVEDAGILLADNRKLRFALYDDGTVIYASPRDTWAEDRYHAYVPTYFRARLSAEEKAKLLSRLNPDELYLLKESSFRGCKSKVTHEPKGHGWTIEGCPTDGPTYFLVYRGGERTVSVEIEYDLDPGPHSNRESIPASVVRIWDVLTQFSAAAEAWKPERSLVTFLNVAESEISKERRATIGCQWPAERADQFPSESELKAGKVCRVLPASLRDATRDWIMKCWGLARPRRHRFVSVRVWDLLPGERPSSLPFEHRCRD